MKFPVLYLSFAFCLLMAAETTAQQSYSQQQPENRFALGIAPFSLLLPSGKANLRGEWAYSHNKSLSLLLSVPRPTPVPGFLSNRLDLDSDVTTPTNRFTSFGAVLEQRFYLSKNAMRGFYFAPYGRYQNLSLTRSMQTMESTYKTTVKGSIGGFGLGVAAGVQFRIGDFLTMDATLVGVDMKWVRGTFNYTSDNPETDLTAFRDKVQSIVGDIPFIGSKLNAEIENNAVKVRTPGLNLPGYRFNLTVNYIL